MSETLTINTISSSVVPTQPGIAEGSPALVPSDGVPGMSTVALESRGDSLTHSQELLLLSRRQSEWAEGILELLKEPVMKVSELDYAACVSRGLLCRKPPDHYALTDQGRRTADEIAQRIAREQGVHIIKYEMRPPSGDAAFAQCTCGWRANKSRYYRSYRKVLRDFGDHHLRHVGAKS